MGIAIRDSVKFRALIVVGLAGFWPATSIFAGDSPALVPLDAVAAAESIEHSTATSPRFSFEESARVVDAVYHKVEKPGVIQVADRRVTAVTKAGHEASPSVEAHIQTKGTSSDKVKKTALTELPLDKLSPQNQVRVQTLLNEVGYYRRLPTTVFAVEPDVYSFFIRYPDVAVSIWRVMGISEMKMWQTGPNEYEGDSGDGSTGTIDVLYRSSELNLLLCEGQYQSPILKKPIKARSLILLKSTFSKEADGAIFVTHRADMYVTFPSQTVETAAKILSPVTGPMADRTFTEMSLFLRMMSLAMTRRPAWVDQVAGQMEGVAEVRKNQLRQVMLTVHNLERKRQGLPSLVVNKPAPPPAKLAREATDGALPANGNVYGPQPLTNSVSNSKFMRTNPASSDSNDSDAQFENTVQAENRPDEDTDSSDGVKSVEPKPVPKRQVEPGYQVIPKRQGSKS
ncbi:MAG: hypothetical protein JWM11_7280 [Planctomycetaceae bacterium]|nr:hypothetical protein [Planctomycetaceae bacterium]